MILSRGAAALALFCALGSSTPNTALAAQGDAFNLDDMGYAFVLPAAGGDGSEFSGGSGTETDPWQIRDAYELAALNNYLNDVGAGKYFSLMNDIVFTEEDFSPMGGDFYNGGSFWIPIGDASNAFRGNFNGNDFAIRGLKINSTTRAHSGLFGTLFGTTLKNLQLEYADTFTVDYNKDTISAGGLAGEAKNVTISNCKVVVNISRTTNGGTYSYIGGLVGSSNWTTI